MAAAALVDDTDDVGVSGAAVSETTDVVVIGAGVSGLCCAAVLACAGVKVTVLEAHSVAGGAAHSFSRPGGYEFDSGPSFFFGLQDPKGTSLNGLAQTLDLLGERVACASYDRWKVYTGTHGAFECTTNAGEYAATVGKLAGPEGLRQWQNLQAFLAPLSGVAGSVPFAALRNDAAVPITLAKFASRMASGFGSLATMPGSVPAAIVALQGSFGALLDRAGVTDPTLRALLDLECFVISGCLADRTPAPEMAFVLSERFRPGATLDWPLGGSQQWIDALVRGIRRKGGVVRTRAPVEQILLRDGRAVGVRLAGGRGTVMARRAVVSSASVWDLAARLLPPGALSATDAAAAAAVPECGSFLHLHAAFDTTGLDLAAIGIHHLVVNNLAAGPALEAPRNVINICIPAALDASMAPPGQASVHVYGAANEPFDDWAHLKRGSAAYEELKAARAEDLWSALARVIPDVRERRTLAMVGSPLTHQRYLRRHRGSYGPAYKPDAWPSSATKLPGLYACGDSTFPGIGIPAAAGSGIMTANTLLPVWDHVRILEDMLRTS